MMLQSTIGRISISVVAQLTFLAALVIAWWTKDQSLQVMLGAAATNATAVVSYWIGSSAGSSAKDAAIATQVAKS